MAVAARTPAAPLDPREFTIGGVTPARAVAPASVTALAKIVRAADAAGEAVVFSGGKTLQALGNPPARYDVAVSLARLNRLIAYEPRDLTVSVEAGMTLASLGRRLARHRQFVPLDAPHPESSTVGGVIASGWYGPRRFAYGRPRDFVIGATVVLADGTVSSSGGRVVKNVSGYDVAKLFAGSLGTLGAIARVNLKTLPMPALRRAAVCRLPDRTRERTLEHIAALAGEPSAALHVWGFRDEIDGRDGIDGRVLLFFEGSVDALDAATRHLRSSLGAAGVPETVLADANAAAMFERTLNAYVDARHGRSATLRIAGRCEDIGANLAIAHRLAEVSGLHSESIADLRGGDITLRVSAPDPGVFAAAAIPFSEELREAFERVVLLDAPAGTRAYLNGSALSKSMVKHARALKDRFDPRDTLAPGRLLVAR